jgi:hypothetical protein
VLTLSKSSVTYGDENTETLTVLRITETPHCRSPKFPRQLRGVEGLVGA